MDMEHIIVKCNNDVFITAYCDDIDGTLLTLRQMPCDAHPETDFPVIDQLETLRWLHACSPTII